MNSTCPFELGEIVVFSSWFRREIYIGRIMQIHIDYWGYGFLPDISKATVEQKESWYNNNSYELVIANL